MLRKIAPTPYITKDLTQEVRAEIRFSGLSVYLFVATILLWALLLVALLTHPALWVALNEAFLALPPAALLGYSPSFLYRLKLPRSVSSVVVYRGSKTLLVTCSGHHVVYAEQLQPEDVSALLEFCKKEKRADPALRKAALDIEALAGL